MNKVRVYNLAKELKIDSRKIIDEACHLGVNIYVPSNWVSEEIANIIRAKFQTKSIPQDKSIALKKVPLTKEKTLKRDIQSKYKSKYKVVKSITRKKTSIIENPVSNHTPLQNTRKIEIILESKKAKRINRKGNCSKCGALINILWQYSQSNIGIVYLCSRCKPIVYGKSFGSVDALNMAEQGGLFERNRRKH